MIVYLIRHGKSQRQSASGRDEDRALVQQGKRQAAWLGEQLDGSNGFLSPQILLVSGYVRAWQTAELIQVRTAGQLLTAPELEPGHDKGDVMRLVDHAVHEQTPNAIALVGHNPMMEYLICALTGQRSLDEIEMRTGTAAAIEIAPEAIALGAGKLVTKLRRDD